MWTAPRTYVAGELMTAAILNTHVRDNLSLLKTSITDDGLEWRGGVRLANAVYLRGRNAANSADIELIRATASDEIGISKGLNFPSTMVPSSDPNTLDDAERVNWTPVLGGAGGTSGQAYSAQTGRAFKFGRAVLAVGRVTLTNKGTITGDLQLQGLPFTAANVLHSGSVTYGYWFGLATSWISLGGYVRQNEAVASIVGRASAGTGVTALTGADVSNSTDIMIAAWYEAAA